MTILTTGWLLVGEGRWDLGNKSVLCYMFVSECRSLVKSVHIFAVRNRNHKRMWQYLWHLCPQLLVLLKSQTMEKVLSNLVLIEQILCDVHSCKKCKMDKTVKKMVIWDPRQRTGTLQSLILVSKLWSSVFIPYLWGHHAGVKSLFSVLYRNGSTNDAKVVFIWVYIF